MDKRFPIPSLATTFNTFHKRSSSTNDSAYTHGLLGVNQEGNYLYINTIVVFFFVLCGFCLLFRLGRLTNSYFRLILTVGDGDQRHAIFSWNQTSLWPWFKRHILYAPLWKKRHNKEIQLSSAISIGTLPSRFHMILLSVYVAANIAYCFVLDYRRDDRAAIIAELRGRSGALGSINIIPTILFAMRNNPLISLLNVSYDTFNLFHRWAARVVIIESVIHVAAWATNAMTTNGGPSIEVMLRESYSFQWGAVAASIFVIIAIQACSPIRHAFYELFINCHRVLVLVALVGVYVHLDTAQLPQLPYILLAFMIWISDWTFRILRVICYNFSLQRRTTVVVEALDSDACRVTFDLARTWNFRPGCHVHVYLPRIGLWSSHPFSVAWSKDFQCSEVEEKLPTTEMSLDGKGIVRTSISLVVRSRQGMTGKLHKLASAAPNKIISIYGAIEGPYGGHESLDSYGTVLLFAAGVGITHQLGYVRHLVQGAVAGTVSTRKIVLVWSVPEMACMEWVRQWMDEILQIPGRKRFLQVHVNITKMPKDEPQFKSSSGSIILIPGRCDVQKVVDDEFVDRTGAMVVTVCGPGLFADDVRHAVRKRVETGSLDFIEESFTY